MDITNYMDKPDIKHRIFKGDDYFGIRVLDIIFYNSLQREIRLNCFPISLEFSKGRLYFKIGIKLFGKLTFATEFYYDEKI